MCQVVEFLENRVNKNFETQSHILIFNFFCCSFLTVAHVISYENVPSNSIVVCENFEGYRINVEIWELKIEQLLPV